MHVTREKAFTGTQKQCAVAICHMGYQNDSECILLHHLPEMHNAQERTRKVTLEMAQASFIT